MGYKDFNVASTTQQYKIYDANKANPKGAIIMVGDNIAGNNIDPTVTTNLKPL